ncbi:MAG: penicillin-binding protein 1C [Bacteroidota bacterium]|nr:penicillin-binding protein 1C [Bacteroidota bacterium]
MIIKKHHRILIWLIVPCILLIVWLLTPVKTLENEWSCVLYDKDNTLLAATIAKDGQWRLPMGDEDTIPGKYKTCLLEFEDKRFRYHAGIDYLAMTRAFLQNINAGKTVSGGSTISMQVIRLSRGAKERNIANKLIEMLLASKLEIRHSKEEILKLYTELAPYGGNVVGLKAAAWRYFGRSPSDLTWAEAALLAVLPNSPASIHMNKNRKALKSKRNRLLKRLYDNENINHDTYTLAIEEEIPAKLTPFPNQNIHLLYRLKDAYPGKHIFHTYINEQYQNQAYRILDRYYKEFRKNDIHNAGAIIAETETGNVIAYIGNTGLFDENGQAVYVDMCAAKRSSGSILKPFLYAGMLSKGEIMPHSLIPDYPVRFGAYSPHNFNLLHDGAVPASKCIARSLNVPAVNLLKKHGIAVFIEDLENIGLTTVNRSAGNYGLSLILGSAESRLDELCAAYASMGRRLLHFQKFNARYINSDVHPLIFLNEEAGINPGITTNYNANARFDAAGIWYALEAMKDVKRPDDKGNWKYYNSEQAIAWKTGTSYGFRDAWAVGLTPDYTLGVWVGNATGEGRPGLIGIKTAAPVLFDLFDMLPAYDEWFKKPYDAMVKMPVCQQSGYLPNPHCPDVDSLWIPKAAYHFPPCPYHKLVHLNEDENFQVSASCYDIEKIKHKPVFVLPPAMEWYYRKSHPEYTGILPWLPGCNAQNQDNVMQIIYPDDMAEIYLPVELGGEKQKVVFKAVHQDNDATIYWYIDDEYITSTKHTHTIGIIPDPGKHHLILTDDHGNRKVIRFFILEKP